MDRLNPILKFDLKKLGIINEFSLKSTKFYFMNGYLVRMPDFFKINLPKIIFFKFLIV